MEVEAEPGHHRDHDQDRRQQGQGRAAGQQPCRPCCELARCGAGCGVLDPSLGNDCAQAFVQLGEIGLEAGVEADIDQARHRQRRLALAGAEPGLDQLLELGRGHDGGEGDARRGLEEGQHLHGLELPRHARRGGR
jgi:hypothetical protein